jgi:hypothetical protein
MRYVLILIASLTPWTACAAQEASVEQLLAQADPAIQAQIRVVLESKGKLQFAQTIETLKEIAREKDKDYLVKQMAISAATPTGAREFEGLITLVVLSRLDVPPGVIIRVLAPHLESENKGLRDFANEWFDGYSRTKFEDPFDEFASYVRDALSRNEEVPTDFTIYLFEQSPGRALLAFNQAAEIGNLLAKMKEIRIKLEAEREERRKKGEDRIIPYVPFGATEQEIAEAEVRDRPFTEFQPSKDLPDVLPRQRDKKLRKEIMLAEHLVSHAVWLKKYKFDEQYEGAGQEAREQLTNLSEHDEWWVRLYVVMIMRQHRELRVSEVWEKLRHDSNVHVSESAGGSPPKPSAQ